MSNFHPVASLPPFNPTYSLPIGAATTQSAPAVSQYAPEIPTLRSLIAERQHPPWEHRIVSSDDSIPLIDLPRLTEPLFALTNRYHGIWRWKAWRNYAFNTVVRQAVMDDQAADISLVLFHRLEPAIQLATILMHRAYPILVRLVQCPIHTDNNGKLLFDPMWIPTKEDYDALYRELVEFQAEYRILRFPPQTPPKYDTLGITGDLFNNDCLRDMNNRSRLTLTALASETLNEIETDDLWAAKSDEAKAVVMVGVAQTLVHELAHALHCRRQNKKQPWFDPFDDRFLDWARGIANGPDMAAQTYYKIFEPRVYPETYYELGWATTTYILGGEMYWPWKMSQNRWDVMNNRGPSMRPDASGSMGMHLKIYTRHDRMPPIDRYWVPTRLIPMFFKDRFWAKERTLIYLTKDDDSDSCGGSPPPSTPHYAPITTPQQMLSMIQAYNVRNNPLGLPRPPTVEDILYRLRQVVLSRNSPLE